jgi:alkylation response protein AidB-like acyl-CoA dehydrogenase
MDLYDSPEEATFRADVRAWLAEHAPRHVANGTGAGGKSAQAVAMPDHVAAARRWQRTLYDGGWAGITLPAEYGGRGGTAIQQVIFNEEQARFGINSGPLLIGLQMVIPTLLAHGSDAQRAAHVDPILRGEELWCQLFSEPGAGSDLASLGTRAVVDGDEYVVNGQKVWNSFAQVADYGILLARTDPSLPKHKGITYFIVPMDTPGFDIRPLRQITGIAHFNEVFMTDVRIPADNVVGEVDAGWLVARTTLGSERAMISGGSSGSSTTRDDIIALAKTRGVEVDPSVRQGIAEAYARISILEYLGFRLRTALSRGEMPGQEASVMKLAFSQNAARTGDLVMEIMGADGMLWGEDAIDHSRWQNYFLGQYAVRIGGGTDEVQRNIIAEQVLGLPRELVDNRGAPWNEQSKS